MKLSEALRHPQDWQTDLVGSAIQTKRGVSWSKDQEHPRARDGAIPVIGISNVQERLELDNLLYLSGIKPAVFDKRRVTAGWSIMVGSNGNRQRVGNAVLIEQDADFMFASFLLAARPRQEADILPQFFFRWLSWEPIQAYLSAASEGTTGLNNLSHGFFRSMQIAYPEKLEQQAICDLLDALDSVIDRITTATNSAQETKRAVLQSFFFDALGRTAYADRPSKELPSGWQLLATAKLLASEPKNGVSPQASTQPPGTPTFSIAAVRDGRVDLNAACNLKYAQIPDKVANKYRIRRGDVLIVRGNANPDLVGKAGMISSFPPGCIYPDITKRVVFRHGDLTVSPQYAVIAWNHSVVHNQVLRRAKTSNGTLKINTRDVKEIIMPVPPPHEQERIAKLVAALDVEIDALGDLMRSYQSLKRSLMYDLLTGTVRVKAEPPRVAEAV